MQHGWQFGLFDETGDFKTQVADRIALLKIPKAGFRAFRLNPERNQPALPRQGRRRLRRGLKRRDIGNVVVAGANQHHIVFAQPQRCQCNRRRRIARRGFHNDLRARIVQLRFDMFKVRGAGHHHSGGKPGGGIAARRALFEQGGIPHQRQERLGLYRTAARPQPGAAAAAQDHGMNQVLAHDIFAHDYGA